jgi:Tol biopolymer transport system component
MLSREDRILSEILVSRGLVPRERIESCAKLHRGGPQTPSLADALVAGGDLDRADARQAVEEARALEQQLAPEIPAGRKLGEFRLVREIGRGGMGIVYEAEQESLNRRVALKVLPAAAALDERLAIRFLREARAAGRLRHPGIVPVYTSGRSEGVLYFAMELVEGRTLAEAIAGGPLPPGEAARIAAEVGRALHHAHAHGLVHRDVKPENILLARDGRAKIADFGLVLEVSAGSLTLSRHALGTPAFIAPEQARGEGVDARSDIYGLGAVLFAMLAGTPPYAGDVPSLVLARVLTERPRNLHVLRPGLAPRLVAICERAMAREPAERYGSAAAMTEDLESFVAGEPEPAPRRGSVRGARLARRLAAAAAVGVALATLALLLRGPFEPAPALERAPAAAFRLLADAPGRKVSPALAPGGRWLAYASDVDGDWDVYRLDLEDGIPENLTPDSPVDDLSPAFSPDGGSIAFASWSQPPVISILDLATGKLRVVAEQLGAGLAWSADGREILFTDRMYDPPGTSSSSSKLFAVAIAGGPARALTGMYVTQPRPAPHAVAFVSPSGGRTDLWTLPQAGGDAVRLTEDESLEWSPAWSGQELLYFGSDRGGSAGLFRIPVDPLSGRAAGEPWRVPAAVFPAPFYLAASGADDGRLAVIGMRHEGRLHRLSFADGPAEGVQEIAALPDRFIAATSPDVSPDGRVLVFTAVTSQEDLALGSPESEPRLLTGDAALDRAPRFAPDGSRIAFHSDRSGKMEIWTIRPDGTGLAQLTSTPADATAPVWSPDGGQIAFSVAGQGAFLVPIDGAGSGGVPQPLPPLAGGAPPFEPGSWSADGRTLAGSARGIVLYSTVGRRYRRLTDSGSSPLWLDERRLVYATDREVHLLDSRSGASRLLFSFVPSRLAGPLGLSPDGRSLYVSLAASPEEVWQVEVTE